jgi:hypothetical protein
MSDEEINRIKAEALKEAAEDLPEYDVPFMVDGRVVPHVYWWLLDRADEIREKN